LNATKPMPGPRMLDDATYEVQRELEFEIEAEEPV
jgi:hypothetical protein